MAKEVSHLVTTSGSKVSVNGKTLSVVNQHKLKGAYAKELSSHGCGACCTYFALALRGKKVPPAKVIKKGISLWGMWPKSGLISARGITTIIKHYGFTATYYPVTRSNKAIVKRVINIALKSGKQVICWTDDNGHKGGPFSSGHHYVMAVGYNKAGKVVVANSGNKGPVNIVSLDGLCRFLQEGNGTDKKWFKTVAGSAGIVVVGPKPQAKKKVVKKPTAKSTTVKKAVKKAASSPVQSYNLSTLKVGAKGQQVRVLQKLVGGLTVDGDFGPKTRAAVSAYQKKHKLVSSGVVDIKTWNSLLSK